ncbi:hypothetical protein [Methanosarcina barkeri]|uniref:Uncharacterized protein n=1 Tax=Methanosarcina barkeri CM1 TaxID=796385 RepID=A0A0G3CD39_METBA|nr:hypothetical protein [Methanosarcina barkeri]AKJ39929.1 hypothetical protein MCM1_2933 [Methanosarcina barkeri CM1]
MLVAAIIATCQTAACQQNKNIVNIGGYEVSVGTVPYGGVVNGNTFGGTLYGTSWSIQISGAGYDMKKTVHDNLANAPMTDMSTFVQTSRLVDGKQASYATANANLRIYDASRGGYYTVPKYQACAMYHIDDQRDCFITVVGSATLSEDILNTIQVRKL